MKSRMAKSWSRSQRHSRQPPRKRLARQILILLLTTTMNPSRRGTGLMGLWSSWGLRSMFSFQSPPIGYFFFVSLIAKATNFTVKKYRLLETGDYYDTIVLVGPKGERRQLHYAILCQNSGYFRRLLRASEKPAEIALPKTDPIVFQHVLRFLYQGDRKLAPLFSFLFLLLQYLSP